MKIRLNSQYFGWSDKSHDSVTIQNPDTKMFDNYFFIYLFGVKIADKDEDEMEKFTDMQYVLQGHKFYIKYGI